jgi:hypothetical protein
MKKALFILALGLGVASTANAQYSPEKGDFAAELGFTPFNTINGSSFQLNEGMVKVRYFLSGKDALRLKLGLGIDSKTTTNTENYNPLEKENETCIDGSVKTTNNATDFSIMLGYERHLFTKGRFDVYAGLELGYLMNSRSGSYSMNGTGKTYDHDGDLSITTTVESSKEYFNQDANGNRSMDFFAANLFAGVDVYVWKNLYLGAECGFSFKTGTSSAHGYFNSTSSTKAFDKNNKMIYSLTEDYNGSTCITNTTTYNGNTTVSDTSYGNVETSADTQTTFNFFVEPAIRIGWRF